MWNGRLDRESGLRSRRHAHLPFDKLMVKGAWRGTENRTENRSNVENRITHLLSFVLFHHLAASPVNSSTAQRSSTGLGSKSTAPLGTLRRDSAISFGRSNQGTTARFHAVRAKYPRKQPLEFCTDRNRFADSATQDQCLFVTHEPLLDGATPRKSPDRFRSGLCYISVVLAW